MNRIYCEPKAAICLLGIRHSAKKVFAYYNLIVRKTGKIFVFIYGFNLSDNF